MTSRRATTLLRAPSISTSTALARPPLDDDPGHERVGENAQVRAPAGGLEVGCGGRGSPAVVDRALPKAEPFRVRAVEVVAGAEFPQGGHRIQERAVQRDWGS